MKAATIVTAILAAIVALVSALLSVASTLQGPNFPGHIIRVGIDPSNPPFAFYDQDRLTGFEVELAERLGARISETLRVSFTVIGFDGIYDALRTEQFHMILGALAPDPLRTNDALYSHPYFDNGLVLVSRMDAPLNRMDDLPGHILAYALGSTAHAESDRWLRRLAPYETRRYELPEYALDAVALMQADAALVQRADALLYLRSHPESALSIAHNGVTVSPYVMLIPFHEARLHWLVNQALHEMERDGELEMLIQRWF
jgi:polar amino acid transport system substrate-binding protein